MCMYLFNIYLLNLYTSKTNINKKREQTTDKLLQLAYGRVTTTDFGQLLQCILHKVLTYKNIRKFWL